VLKDGSEDEKMNNELGRILLRHVLIVSIRKTVKAEDVRSVAMISIF